jgi:hypothetical protein
MGMEDMKVHTTYWSQKLRRRNQLWKYSHSLEKTFRIYREVKEGWCWTMWLSIESCVRPLWTWLWSLVPRKLGYSLTDWNN